MKILRGFLAVVCLVLGVIALALWGTCQVVVNTVEDGTVVTGIAQKVVEQPAVQAAITSKTQSYVTASLSEAGVDIASLGLQGTLDDAVAAAVASPAFQASLTDAIDGARADFAEQLTSPDFKGEPLVVNLDVSAVINDTIASIPVVGSLVPALTLDPLPIEVAGADEFGKVRGTYSVIDFLAKWAGWIGLVLIVLGVLLMPRKRWLLPLALLFAGLGAGALWAAMRWLTVDRIAGSLPGGADGDLGGALVKFARQESLDRFSHRIFLIAAACLVGAVVSFIIVKIASRPAKRRAAASRTSAAAPPTTGVSATGPQATGPDATGPAVTGVSATGPQATGPDGAGLNLAEPQATGLQPTGPDVTGPNPTGPGASGLPAAGASATGAEHPHGQHEEHNPGHAR